MLFNECTTVSRYDQDLKITMEVSMSNEYVLEKPDGVKQEDIIKVQNKLILDLNERVKELEDKIYYG